MKPASPHKPNFMVKTKDAVTGEEKKVKMRNGFFANGSPQPFYFPDNHSDSIHAGQFKGMKTIIQEQRER
jgi:hypothetical protein